MLASPIILGGLPVLAYDMFAESKPFSRALYDAALMTSSSFVSKIISTLLNTKIID